MSLFDLSYPDDSHRVLLISQDSHNSKAAVGRFRVSSLKDLNLQEPKCLSLATVWGVHTEQKKAAVRVSFSGLLEASPAV